MEDTHGVDLLAGVDSFREILEAVFGTDQAVLALTVVAAASSVAVVAPAEPEVQFPDTRADGGGVQVHAAVATGALSTWREGSFVAG